MGATHLFSGHSFPFPHFEIVPNQDAVLEQNITGMESGKFGVKSWLNSLVHFRIFSFKP